MPLAPIGALISYGPSRVSEVSDIERGESIRTPGNRVSSEIGDESKKPGFRKKHGNPVSYLSLNSKVSVVIARTGLPSSVPGSNVQRRATRIASRSRPFSASSPNFSSID